MPRKRHDQVNLSPQAVRVLRQFRALFNSVRKHFRATEQKAGISGAHVWALSLVAEHPGIGVGALADAMDVHQSTASNLLRALVADALVTTEKTESDRRAVQLTITAAGLQQLPAATLKRLERDLGEVLAQVRPRQRTGERTPLGGRQD